ncbi:MAG: hypothetical protein ABI557_21365 [Aureliella sp.]
MNSNSRASISIFAIALAFVLSGCSGGLLVKPVDAEVARNALQEVLETWKRGGHIADLRSNSPSIVVQEMDWSRGMKLQEFRLLDEGREEDANLFCRVELTLLPATGGEPVKKTVVYVIGTDPVLTVFRAII